MIDNQGHILTNNHVVADADNIYLEANESACRMLGYERHELIGLGAADIVAPAESANVAPVTAAIRNSAVHHREWSLRRKDGTTFPAEVIATLMPDGNLLGMLRDVTERRELRDQLRLHSDHLEQLVQERTARVRQLEQRQRQMEKLKQLLKQKN